MKALHHHVDLGISKGTENMSADTQAKFTNRFMF